MDWSIHRGVRSWHWMLTSSRCESIADFCIYTSSVGGDVFHIGVYSTGKHNNDIKRAKEELSSKFDMRSSATSLEWLWTTRTDLDGTASVCVKNFNVDNYKPVRTPVADSSKLVKTADEEVRALLISSGKLDVYTRPDIVYTVNTLAKFSNNQLSSTGWQ